MKKTDVILVLDLSGSMRGDPEIALRRALNDYLEALLAGVGAGLAFNVTPLYFSSVVRPGPTFSVTNGLARAACVEGASTYTRDMAGMTALMDAVGNALSRVRPGVPTLISVFTDGGENQSRVHNAAGVRSTILRLQETGLLTLTCAGPREALNLLGQCGIPAENFRPWDGSAVELAAVAQDTVQAVQTYSRTRSLGGTATKRFYADATKLTPSGVKALTQQVTPRAIETVPQPMAGRPICDLYGPRFEQGKHYYELVKPEYIREDSDLIVHVKDHDEYRRGSRGVRAMLGVPETGRIRVHPGPHTEKFKIFVQSASFNRKLVEGQQLLTVD